MNKHLRRLAPALAALVVGCNINESASTEVASTSTGTISPRLTMVNGSTIPQVDSLLVQLTVEGSSYSQDLKVGWNDAALQLKQIPLNKKWTLKIAGFMHADTVLANRDTVWYGVQTGTLTESTPQTKNATALAFGLKSAAKTPAVDIGANAPGTTQKVGDVFSFTSESATQIVWTLDGTQPKCPDSLGTTKPLVLDAALANQTVTLKARACTAGELPGRVAQYRFAVVAKDVVLPPTIRIPIGFDSLGTATVPYDSSLTLSLPEGTTLTWNLALVSGTTTPSAADWNRIAAPTASDFTGNTAAIKVSSALIATMAPTATEAQVLVKAVLWQGAAAIDAATFHWTLSVPVTTPPELKVKPYSDSVRVSWAANQVDSLWAKRAEETTRTKVALDSKDTTFVHTLKPGQADSFWALRKDPKTGRFSDTTRLISAALLPPVKPKFTIANPSGKGQVTVTLDAQTRDEARTKWFVAHANDSSSLQFSTNDTITNGSWSGYMSQGSTVIGIKAVRDGLEAIGTETFSVIDTSGGRPEKVVNLRLVARDSNSLTWEWGQMPDRTFRVFVKSSAVFSNISDTASTFIKVTTDSSFVLSSLAKGASYSIAVVTVAKETEKAGNSEPTYSALATTKNPPVTPSWYYIKNDSTGTVSWNLSSDESGTVWQALWGTSLAKLDTFGFGSNKIFTKSPISGTGLIGIRAIRDSVVRDSILGQAITVKYTNYYAPNAPENLSATAKGTDSLLLTWSLRDKHTYLVKWKYPSNAVSDLSTPTGSATVSSMGSKLLTGLQAGTSVVYSVQVIAAPDSTKGPSIASIGTGKTNAYIPKNLGTTSLSATSAIIVGNRLSVTVPSPSEVTYPSLTPASPSKIVARLYKGINLAENLTVNSTSITKIYSLDSNSLGSYSLYIQHVWANGDTTTSQEIALHSYSPSSLSLTNYAGGINGDTIDVATPSSSTGWGYPEFQAYDGINQAWSPATFKDGKITGPSAMQRIRHRFTYVTTATGDSSMWVETAIEKHGTMTDSRDKMSYPTVRFNGLTWMATNLNYNIPSDTMDVCYQNSADSCSKYGRLYTISQAWNLPSHDCDTLVVGTTGCTISVSDGVSQGACPSNWHMPTALEWSSLLSVTPVYTADWGVNSSTYLDTYGINIGPSGRADVTNGSPWAFSGGSGTSTAVALFWSATQHIDQTYDGPYIHGDGARIITEAQHQTWFFNPQVHPIPRSAFSIRCVKD